MRSILTSLRKENHLDLLQGCYKVVYKVVTRLLQGCYEVDTRLLPCQLHTCNQVVTRLLHNFVATLLQGCYNLVFFSMGRDCSQFTGLSFSNWQLLYMLVLNASCWL